MYAHVVMGLAAILVFQNSETAAILLYQTNPVGVQVLSFVPINVHGFLTRLGRDMVLALASPQPLSRIPR